MTASKIASLLGRLNRGKKKNLTDAERERRRRSLAKARKLRWEGKR